MSINHQGLRGWRPEQRKLNDPDETEGRAIYRSHAQAEARRSMWRNRKISLEKTHAAKRNLNNGN